MADVYLTPTEVLANRREWLKQRLKAERIELRGLEEKLTKNRDEGLAKLVGIVEMDAETTAALVADFGMAIRKLKGKKSA